LIRYFFSCKQCQLTSLRRKTNRHARRLLLVRRQDNIFLRPDVRTAFSMTEGILAVLNRRHHGVVSILQHCAAAIVVCLLLSACATGTSTDLVPSQRAVRCSEATTMQVFSIAISGSGTAYYIVPLWLSSWDKTKEALVVRLYFATTKSIEHMAPDSLVLHNSKTGERHSFSTAYLKSAVSGEKMRFLTYDVAFPRPIADLDAFELIFAQAVYDCQPPAIVFTRKSAPFNMRLL